MFIIFQDSQLSGYLDDEKSAVQYISKLCDCLTESLKQTEKIRIFKENISNGICIYVQQLGNYFNGAVELKHTVYYKQLEKLNI